MSKLLPIALCPTCMEYRGLADEITDWRCFRCRTPLLEYVPVSESGRREPPQDTVPPSPAAKP